MSEPDQVSDSQSEKTSIIKYLKAILILQLQNLTAEETSKERPEILLFRSGFSRHEIADLLGKTYEAVKKALQ